MGIMWLELCKCFESAPFMVTLWTPMLAVLLLFLYWFICFLDIKKAKTANKLKKASPPPVLNRVKY